MTENGEYLRKEYWLWRKTEEDELWKRTDCMEKSKMSKEKECIVKKERLRSYKVSQVKECKVSKKTTRSIMSRVERY